MKVRNGCKAIEVKIGNSDENSYNNKIKRWIQILLRPRRKEFNSNNI
jgi:hypothetical protein